MGMESFSIIALPDGVDIIRDKEYRHLKGNSNIFFKDFELELGKLENIVRRGECGWVLDDCIEIIVYNSNGFFQGIELKGCLSYLDDGVDLGYDFIEIIRKKIVSLKIYIFNREVEVGNSKQLCKLIKEMYSDKIAIFQKQYNDVKLKATCGEFYREMKNRKKWYYKLLHNKK